VQADHSDALEPRRRSWLVALPFMIFVLIAVGWSIFWFVATSATGKALSEWRTREAAVGRIYRCGKESLGGFPFRFELRCTEPSAEFKGGPQPAALSARDFVVVDQVWQPTLLIAEMIGPLMIGEPGAKPSFAVNWSLAQASLRGLPLDPQRAAVVIDQASLASVGASAQTMLANAGRLEFHGRIESGTARDHPVLDLALSLTQASASRLGALAAVPFDADISGVLRGLPNLAFRSWPETLRALQAANGRLEVSRARVKQGEVLAVGSGSLGLTPRGALDGELQVTIANIEKLLPALGVDRAISQLIPPGTIERLVPGLNRLVPGLSGMLRGNSAPAAKAGNEALGPSTELEGKSAITLPLRFTDGVVTLGPFKVAEVPPLY
jgi:hypothetical protein